jgi:hypothetical protein
MRYRDRKPFQCRACGWVCYRLARRAKETVPPLLVNDRPYGSAENLLKLSGALARASEHRDETVRPAVVSHGNGPPKTE